MTDGRPLTTQGDNSLKDAAQDLATIRDALKIIEDWLPTPQNGAGSVEYDKAARYVRGKHRDAISALASLEAPRLVQKPPRALHACEAVEVVGWMLNRSDNRKDEPI